MKGYFGNKRSPKCVDPVVRSLRLSPTSSSSLNFSGLNCEVTKERLMSIFQNWHQCKTSFFIISTNVVADEMAED